MNKNLKIFLQLAGLFGVGYVVYKAYITHKKEVEEGITSEEIQDIKTQKETKEEVERFEKVSAYHISEEYEEEEPDKFIVTTGGIDLDIEPDYEEPDDISEDYFEEEDANDVAEDTSYFGGEEEELRHDPNSKEAIDQYRMMMLSDYEIKPDIYDTLQMVWDYSYSPINQRDETIFLHITEERERFFGPNSVYSNGATMAELLIFFANKLSFDYSVPIVSSMRLILDSLELDDSVGATKLASTLSAVEKHNFVSSQNRFGIFGLTLDDYRHKLCKYPQVVIKHNADVGFDMEYNVFCDLYGDEFEEGVNA